MDVVEPGSSEGDEDDGDDDPVALFNTIEAILCLL